MFFHSFLLGGTLYLLLLQKAYARRVSIQKKEVQIESFNLSVCRRLFLFLLFNWTYGPSYQRKLHQEFANSRNHSTGNNHQHHPPSRISIHYFPDHVSRQLSEEVQEDDQKYFPGHAPFQSIWILCDWRVRNNPAGNRDGETSFRWKAHKVKGKEELDWLTFGLTNLHHHFRCLYC